MPSRFTIVPALVLPVLLAGAGQARADVTAFLGRVNTADSRSARGFAVAFSLVVVAFEFEYADVPERQDVTITSPGLRTVMFNGLLQTPVPIGRFHLYATLGAGMFRERLSANEETNVGFNTGAGVKIRLVGPLRLRLDYRVFKLSGEPLYSKPQRFYAGVNLAF